MGLERALHGIRAETTRHELKTIALNFFLTQRSVISCLHSLVRVLLPTRFLQLVR